MAAPLHDVGYLSSRDPVRHALNGSLALAVRAGTGHERWARPVVRVVRAVDGTLGPQPAEVDLFGRPEEPAPRVAEPAGLEPPIAATCRAMLAVSTG